MMDAWRLQCRLLLTTSTPCLYVGNQQSPAEHYLVEFSRGSSKEEQGQNPLTGHETIKQNKKRKERGNEDGDNDYEIKEMKRPL